MSNKYSNQSSYLNYDKNSFNELPCDNALEFQHKIEKFRKFDDKIINVLNSEIPTESFYSQKDPSKKCLELNNEIQQYYKFRSEAINKCVNQAKNEIVALKQSLEDSSSSSSSKFLIREKQFNLRQFEEALVVEEIIRNRSLKAIQERCRAYI